MGTQLYIETNGCTSLKITENEYTAVFGDKWVYSFRVYKKVHRCLHKQRGTQMSAETDGCTDVYRDKGVDRCLQRQMGAQTSTETKG